MLDCGGDKVVLTPEEFLAAAKQCMDAEAQAAGDGLVICGAVLLK